MASPPNAESRDSHPGNNHIDDPASDNALAQAFKDLARGEKTAQALESNLTNLEKRIDELLASFEASEQEAAPSGATSGGNKAQDSTAKENPE